MGDVLRIVVKVLRYVAGAALGLPVLPLVLDRARDLVAIALVGVAAMVAFLRVSPQGGRRAMCWFVAALAPYLLLMPTSMYLYMATCGVFWLWVARCRTAAERHVRMTWLIAGGIAGHRRIHTRSVTQLTRPRRCCGRKLVGAMRFLSKRRSGPTAFRPRAAG
jgi:hypothetical protein